LSWPIDSSRMFILVSCYHSQWVMFPCHRRKAVKGTRI
jgi:hypothetical protein